MNQRKQTQPVEISKISKRFYELWELDFQTGISKDSEILVKDQTSGQEDESVKCLI